MYIFIKLFYTWCIPTKLITQYNHPYIFFILVNGTSIAVFGATMLGYWYLEVRNQKTILLRCYYYLIAQCVWIHRRSERRIAFHTMSTHDFWTKPPRNDIAWCHLYDTAASQQSFLWLIFTWTVKNFSS